MKYKKLGTSDLEVSRVCLGTMTFGEQNTLEDGHEQLDYSIAQGVNFIDTAEMYSVPGRAETYGETERIIGKWLEKTGKRKDVILATKVVGPSATGLKYIRKGPNHSPEHILEAIEGSLKNLRTDVIDLYQVHWPERGNNKFGQRLYPYEENEGWVSNMMGIVETMDSLVKQGKIRYWGLSNETAWGVMKYLEICKENNLVKPVSIQNAYGLMNRQCEYGISEVCQFEGLGVMAYSPLAFGALTGKYLDGVRPEGARLTEYSIFNRFLNPRAMEAVSAYKKLAEENGMSVVELALAFVYNQPFVHSTIIGATKMPQLKENISSESIDLSPGLLKEVNKLFNQYPDPAL